VIGGRMKIPEYSLEKLAANYPTRKDSDLLSGPYMPAYLVKAVYRALVEENTLLSEELQFLKGKSG
jgi:hypothetical protein